MLLICSCEPVHLYAYILYVHRETVQFRKSTVLRMLTGDWLLRMWLVVFSFEIVTDYVIVLSKRSRLRMKHYKHTNTITDINLLVLVNKMIIK